MSQESTRIAIRDHVLPAAAHIADAFYEGMLADPQAAVFLDSDLVDRRLRGSMTQWITDTFSAIDEESREAQQHQHARVGLVHARVNVPISLVSRGMGILRQECWRYVQRAGLERETLVEALLLTADILDEAALQINQSYLDHVLEHERTDQSLRLHVVSQNLAIECERLRSGLFNWMRRILMSLFSDSSGTERPEPLAESEFGLWIEHKAELLFPDLAETEKLGRQVARVDDAVREARRAHRAGNSAASSEAVATLDREVSQTAWLLSALVEHALESERARDPLTRVLSRRYMPSILQRQIKLGVEGRSPFAVLLIDIDDFKLINDTSGHAAGDGVLRGVGEILLSTLRASDFIFRFGGDEFLAVLGRSSPAMAQEVAERVRRCVEGHDFSDLGRRVTVSVGIALHEGHPDYTHVVDRADQALMQAKAGGKNRSALAARVA